MSRLPRTDLLTAQITSAFVDGEMDDARYNNGREITMAGKRRIHLRVTRPSVFTTSCGVLVAEEPLKHDARAHFAASGGR